MEQTADRLEREVWPVANARQFVLTFPHQVRRWLAASPELLSVVVLVVTDVIKDFYEDSTLRESDRESVAMPTTGTITFIQRFASSLTVKPHLHIVALDGFSPKRQGKKVLRLRPLRFGMRAGRSLRDLSPPRCSLSSTGLRKR